ncbi:hypothetical protein C4569_03125 [Candidatus Parcubacteria bacterium]|nr:MAG: hypothetical protein C4569_03125 [Candidatus Parcubacteria bacterium]
MTKDFYWERIAICSFIGAGGGISVAFLLGQDFKVFVFLGVAVGIALSTVMEADLVAEIRPAKKSPKITLERTIAKEFKEKLPDDIRGLKE